MEAPGGKRGGFGILGEKELGFGICKQIWAWELPIVFNCAWIDLLKGKLHSRSLNSY